MIFDNAQQKQENQIKAIRNFILQEVDYIVLDPIVMSGWDNVLQNAKEAEIPVILVDRDVELDDDSLYVTSVVTDMVQKDVMPATGWRTIWKNREEKMRIFKLSCCWERKAHLHRSAVRKDLQK